jgi:hypothetical protein
MPAIQRSRDERDSREFGAPRRANQPAGATNPRDSRVDGYRSRDGYGARDAFGPRLVDDRRGAPPRSPGIPANRASRLEGGRSARARVKQRRRRALLLALVLLTAVVVGIDLLRDNSGGTRATADLGHTPLSGASGEPSSVPSGTADPTPTQTKPEYKTTGPGTFSYATAPASAIFGTAGTLHRFKVAVEKETGSDADEFAAQVEKILSDPRSWIAGKNVRLQRVPQGSASDFTIYLATPGTSEKMCAVGGLQTERYTSCRLPGQVIINLDRWWDSTPDYDAPLDVYREYAINHEVGHELGHGHEACPGAGELAPVMQQQTYGLKGCLANAWPYVDGKRYSGEPIP